MHTEFGRKPFLEPINCSQIRTDDILNIRIAKEISEFLGPVKSKDQILSDPTNNYTENNKHIHHHAVHSSKAKS